MTVNQIIIHNTGITEAEADFYAEVAEMKVRTYLNYSDDDGIDKFTSAIAAIATILYNQEKCLKNLTDNNNSIVKSESFSEGSVSVNKSYLTNADISDNSESQINTELQKLKQYRKIKVL